METRLEWLLGDPMPCRVAYPADPSERIQPLRGVVRATRRTLPHDPISYDGAVAIKFASSREARPLETARRLSDAIAALPHPSLARPLEVFDYPGGTVNSAAIAADNDLRCAVSVWIDGASLTELAPMPSGDAIRLVCGLAGAVNELHSIGLVHRDLHPDNVIVQSDGTGVVIDYDSVEEIRRCSNVAPLAPAGVIGFVPPEGLNGAAATPAADRWAVGMLTVFALLGHPQGSGSTTELEAELAARLIGLPSAARVQQLILAMISADPRRRPALPIWAATLSGCLAS
jgi:serine/threonine protein kinase